MAPKTNMAPKTAQRSKPVRRQWSIRKNSVNSAAAFSSKSNKTSMLNFIGEFGDDILSEPYLSMSNTELRMECINRQKAYVDKYAVNGGRPSDPAENHPDKLHVMYTTYLRKQIKVKEAQLQKFSNQMAARAARDPKYRLGRAAFRKKHANGTISKKANSHAEVLDSD